jgi:hypothetical protein
VTATLQARTAWETGSRLTLVGGLLAFALSMYFLGREEPLPAAGEADSAPPPEDSHEMPYGPSLGMAAGIVMLVQDRLMDWFGPGLQQMWLTVTG